MYHNVEWTSEKIKNFWDYKSIKHGNDSDYFSNIFGQGIVKYLSQHKRIGGKILDLGCGPGYFMKYLLDYDCEIYGSDSSLDSINSVKQLYSNNSKVKKIKCNDITQIEYENNFFDIVFLIEVVEHMSSDYLESALKEVNRVLKSGGILVITTPFNEDLDKKKVICPDCGCVFHPMQHLKSFNKDKLSKILLNNKFNPIVIESLNFYHYKYGKLMRQLYLLKNKLFKKYKPHLIAISYK